MEPITLSQTLTFGGIIVATALLITMLKIAINVGVWKAGVDGGIKALNTKVDRLNTKVDRIIDTPNIDGISKSKSARALSDLGCKISKEIDAKKLAHSLAPKLAERSKFMGEYDVQELCYEYVRYEYKPDPEIEEKMKSSAYHNNGISVHSVLAVLALELRDVLLKSRKGKSRE